jgi:hypothetical protein
MVHVLLEGVAIVVFDSGGTLIQSAQAHEVINVRLSTVTESWLDSEGPVQL